VKSSARSCFGAETGIVQRRFPSVARKLLILLVFYFVRNEKKLGRKFWFRFGFGPKPLISLYIIHL